MRILGMMSGTSTDGVDAVIMDIDGFIPDLEWKILFHHHVDFSETLRDEIFACFRPETGSVDRLCKLNFALGKVYGEAALETIKAAGMQPDEIDLIGSHGQTLWHIPANIDGASTLQMGEPTVIAEITGLPVVSNFRTADMAAGGHGAPLVSFADVCLFSSKESVRAAQNIGGIGNVTYIPRSGDSVHLPIAFDTGPGNMLIDDAIERITNGEQHFDRDGLIAASGKVNEAFLSELLRDPYLQMKPPKTTGREYFGKQMGERLYEEAKRKGISDKDYVATVTDFTAESIVQAYHDFLPEFPEEVIVHGGGAHNPVLMAALKTKLSPSKVLSVSDFGILPEAKEGMAFALMAYQTWHKQQGNIPSATGARHPAIMGNITFAPLRFPKKCEEMQTESQNPKTTHIDEANTIAMVQMISEADKAVQPAVERVLPEIAKAVDAIAERMSRGGRMIYFGAGTSGRLGVLDVSEVLPTFGVQRELVFGRIAGGNKALTEAIEGAEDNPSGGREDVHNAGINETDSVIGITASGRTPYVLGAMEEAHKRGALTVGVACNGNCKLQQYVDIAILPNTGPEVISGSTRMKAGTAQKMILNMLSTSVMIKLGKTFGNLMVDVSPSNEKLIVRQRRIVAKACNISEDEASKWLESCSGETKTAIVACLKRVSAKEARGLLCESGGFVKKAIAK